MERIRRTAQENDPQKLKSFLNVLTKLVILLASLILVLLVANIQQINDAFDDVCEENYEEFDTGRCDKFFEKIEQKTGRKTQNGTAKMKNIDPNLVDCCSRYRYEESISTMKALTIASIVLCVLTICILLVIELLDCKIQRNTKSSNDMNYDAFKQQGGSASNLLEPKVNEWKSPFNKRDSGLDSPTPYDSTPP